MITRKQSQDEMKTTDNEKDFFVKVIVKVSGRIIEQDIEESLSIPTVDKLTLPMIQQMLAENPSLHARWNVLYNEAVYDFDIMKTKFEVWMSKKSSEYRKELEKIAKGRVTDRMVEDMIHDDPDFTRYSDDLALSKKNMKHIFAIANGFGEKGDRIVNIASMMKWEVDALGRGSMTNKNYNHIKRDYKEAQKENFDTSVNDGWPTA